MSAYLSNLLTNTTSRYNSLRRTLLSNEDDGDTEDDSHISRVLRAYYTEKGRPFPPWLPPDPNERLRPALGTNQPSSSYFSRPVATLQAQYSSSTTSGTPAAPRTSLSDLWDTPSAQPPTTTGPQSLRAARRPPGAAATPPPQQQYQQQQYLQPQQQQQGLAPPSARPLPSQRAGSYQSQRSGVGGGSYEGAPGGGGAGGGGGTAQDRLKAKLWGAQGRGPSPGPSPMGPRDMGGYDQQQQQQQGRRW